MKHIYLSFLIFPLLLFAQDCEIPDPYIGNTGANMTVMLTQPFISSLNVTDPDAYIVAIRNGSVVGSVVVAGITQVAFPVWGDDAETTDVVDGALAGDAISFKLIDGEDLFDVDMPTPVSYSTNIVVPQLAAAVVTGPCVLGCTDATADNYNMDATEDDGSCVYNYSVGDPISYYLSEGWNMVGFTGCEITPIEDALGNGSSLEETFNIIKDVRGRMWHPALGENSLLTHLTPGEGYMMFVNGDPTSVQFSEEYCNDITYQLNSGWNMVAFTGGVDSESGIVTALDAALENGAGAANTFQVIKNVSGQFWSTAFATLQSFTPGKAYLMNVIDGQETTLSFTENSTQVFENNPGVEFTLPATDNNMSVVFSAGVLNDFVGYEIYVKAEHYMYMNPADQYNGVGPSSIYESIVSENHMINDDGSVGIAVIGSGNPNNGDINLANQGDSLQFYITSPDGTLINLDLDQPSTYQANGLHLVSEPLGFLIDGEQVVFGCIDPNYLEFNPVANLDDNSCNTFVICGCMDSFAINYNPNANTNQDELHGFCDPCIAPEFGCTEFHAFNFNPDANVNDGSCQMPYFESFDFFPVTTDNSMTAIFSEGVLSDFEGGLLQAYIDGNPVSQSEPILDIYGGASVYGIDPFCQCDYAQSGDEITFSILVGGHTVVDIETDLPLAYEANGFYLDWWNSINFTIDGNPVIEGCTNSSYVEFNPNANLYDGSCLTRAIYGCNDVLACNYINADINDGSCVYPGCTDNNFIEYYNQGFVAGCDNGSCANLVKDLGLEVSHFQDPMITGTSMNIGFNLSNNIQGIENATVAAFYDLNGDGIINTDVYTANNGLNFSECVGLTDFSNDFFTLALWGDDSSTDVVDGLQSGQSEVVFALLTQDNQVIAFNLDPEFPSFNSNGLYVVNNIDFNVVLYGCMDSNDCNYNPEAEEDDGSCIGAPDCKDPLYFEYNENAGCNDQEMCSNTWQDLYYTALDSASLAFEIDEAQDQDILDSTQAELEYWSSPIVIDLNIGWNMIGYTFKEPQDVVASMSEVYEIIDIVKDNQAEVYWPEFGFNGIGDLIPGQGYQVKVEEAYEGFYFADVDGQRFDLVPTVPQWAINMQVESHPNDIRTLVRVVNMLGQEVNPDTEPKGTVLLYLYNDATVEKKLTK